MNSDENEVLINKNDNPINKENNPGTNAGTSTPAECKDTEANTRKPKLRTEMIDGLKGIAIICFMLVHLSLLWTFILAPHLV